MVVSGIQSTSPESARGTSCGVVDDGSGLRKLKEARKRKTVKLCNIKSFTPVTLNYATDG
jgi:hypothetical protein